MLPWALKKVFSFSTSHIQNKHSQFCWNFCGLNMWGKKFINFNLLHHYTDHVLCSKEQNCLVIKSLKSKLFISMEVHSCTHSEVQLLIDITSYFRHHFLEVPWTIHSKGTVVYKLQAHKKTQKTHNEPIRK